MASKQADKTNRKPRQCKSPYQIWLTFSTWYIRTLSRIFAWSSSIIAHYPWITLIACLAFVGFCCLGFIRIQVENRAEKLFIPQDSRAIRDLKRAEKHFTLDSRIETLIFVPRRPTVNVLSPQCMMDILKVHEAVTRLPSYQKLCVTTPGMGDSNNTCLLISPLEIFDFNTTKIVNVKQNLETAYTNKSMYMRNGRSVSYNFKMMLGGLKMDTKTGEIDSVAAIQVVYVMRKPQGDHEHEQVMKWEKGYMESVAKTKSGLTCAEVHAAAARSFDDAIGASSGTDIKLFSIAFCLMISFTCIMLGKFRNPLTGHSLLANAGIVTVFLGILAGFGFTMMTQTPFVSIAGTLAFLIIGIGIDDMFIIVDELDRINPGYSVADTVKIVMANSGATVTMTTVTDLVAFAVSMTSELPAITYFCTYAALSISFTYLLIVTLFVALMSFDVRRVKSGRRDCLPVCPVTRSKEGAPTWNKPHTSLTSKILTYWARGLMRTDIKCLVVIVSLVLFGCGMYGALNISEEFDAKILVKDSSPFLEFYKIREKYFEMPNTVSIIVDEKVNYTDAKTQKGILELTTCAVKNPFYKDTTTSWMSSLLEFSKRSKLSTEGRHFIPTVHAFLRVPRYKHFLGDIRFSSDGREIQASRVLCYIKGSMTNIEQRDAMVTLRRDLDTLTTVPAYPITKKFIYWEQYAITVRATTRNLVIASVSILIITLPFLVDVSATILVFFGFIALVFELFGLMYIWGVTLNGISMINLIMAIGFAVDYSAHIAHAYVISSKVVPEERVVDAFRTLGTSVLMGGISTFVGTVVLAFASSHVFRIFFKMFFGIVLLGLLHGLCFLPVYLTIFCRAAPLNAHKRHVGASEGSLDSQEMNGFLRSAPLELDSASTRLSGSPVSDGSSVQSLESPNEYRQSAEHECDDGSESSTSSLPPPDPDRETTL